MNKRAKTLVEMAEAARFYYLDPRPYDEAAAAKFLTPAAAPVLTEAARRLTAMARLAEEELGQLLQDLARETGRKVVDVAQPLRVALTGKTTSPSLTEIIPILGQAEVLRRLNNALQFAQK